MAAKRIHFIGVAGIGMSSLACGLADAGYVVTGSDETAIGLSRQQLDSRQIQVDSYSQDNICHDIDEVVFGASVKQNNPELLKAKSLGLLTQTLPQAVARHVALGQETVLVIGSHGKSTCSAVLATTLNKFSTGSSHFIGGVPKGDLQGTKVRSHSRSGVAVIEGDEYKSTRWGRRPKFVEFEPAICLCNPTDDDHLDIYPNKESLELRIREFILTRSKLQLFVVSGNNNIVRDIASSAIDVEVTGIEDGWHSRNEVMSNNLNQFEIRYKSRLEGVISTTLPGNHNIQNLVGCFAVLRSLGMRNDRILRSFAEFEGLSRRWDVLSSSSNLTVIEDFAHHPTSIRATIETARARYPSSKIITVYKPATPSTIRTGLEDRLLGALSGSDAVEFVTRSSPDQIDFELNIELIREGLEKRGVEWLEKTKIQELGNGNKHVVLLLLSNAYLATADHFRCCR